MAAASRYKPNLMIVDEGLGRGSGVSAVEQIDRDGPLAHVFYERRRRKSPGTHTGRSRGSEAVSSGQLVKAIELALGAALHAQV